MIVKQRTPNGVIPNYIAFIDKVKHAENSVIGGLKVCYRVSSLFNYGVINALKILDRDSIWLILPIDDDQKTVLFLCGVVHNTSNISTYYTHVTMGSNIFR